MSGKWMLLLAMVVLLHAPSAFAKAQSTGACDLPSKLEKKLSEQFPGTRVVSLADLADEDRKLYQADHGSRCPGAVDVDFYGDRKPTWAIALISETGEARKVQLLVAHLEDSGWSVRSLETSNGTPVVWEEKPGRYKDVYGEKTILAKYPVIVLCFYEASAIVYSWTGQKTEKVWISD